MAGERLHTRFGFKLFAAVVAVSAVALLLAGVIVARALANQTTARIERGLVAQAKMAAELLGREGAASLDEEADRLSSLIDARVTFIRHDGVVLGDSAEEERELASLENHAGRPEVQAARTLGVGVSRRYSTTTGVDMLYVAVPVRHPSFAFIRLAVPLTEVQQQLRAVRTATAAALGIALVAALAVGWGASALLSRRVRAIASAAERHERGEISAVPVDYGSDELGRVARALDSSMRTLAARAAEATRARARLEAILAGMVEGVIVVDDAGRLELANGAAQQMLRFDADRVGHPVLEAVRYPAVVDLLTRASSNPEMEDAEVDFVTAEGAALVVRAARFKAAGDGGVVLVLRDVTSFRQTDQVRRDFVANVSHELRTPLAAIRGYVEALRDAAADEPDTNRFLEVIERNADRMERLVRDLLRLARIEAGQEELEIGAVAVEPLFDQVVADMAPHIEARCQRTAIEVENGPDLAVRADARTLGDILKNLVENAVHYSPEGSLITIGARRTTDGRVELTVADEGPGIPEQHLTRVFERFYRVDPARSRESGGTGLGLSIVKHLAELLGGRVEAANRPEGGALFRVILEDATATMPGNP